jgi:hypothetical protein
MKILKILILFASFFAIAGAAFFQLFVLLAHTLFARHAYDHSISRPG